MNEEEARGTGGPGATRDLVEEIETVVGPLLMARDDEVITAVVRANRAWELAETRFLRSVLRPGQTFVDVGAHVGYFTVLAAGRVGPTGSVLALEPEARNLDLLRRNVARLGFGNVEVLPVAAARSRGRMSLALDERNRGGHHLVPLGEAPTEVDCVRLDDVLPERVDVVKVDAQGYDHDIIAGMERTIAANPQMTVMVELSVEELGRRRLDPAEVVEGYGSLGFTFSILDPLGHPLASSAADVLAKFRAEGALDFNIVLRRAALHGAGRSPRASHPTQAAHLEVNEVPDGLVVHQVALGRVHQLNQTAALIFDLCTGTRSLEEIATCVQETYGLPAPPTSATEQCIDQLLGEGLLL